MKPTVKKTKKPKKPTHKQLKTKAWFYFSRYIRLRDCNAYQKNGMVAPCFTCHTITHFNKLQAGHFLQGRGNSILFDEDGVHAQCVRCNIWLRGNPDEYWPKMVSSYGLEKVEEMVKRKHQLKDYSDSDLEEIISKYKILVDSYSL